MSHGWGFSGFERWAVGAMIELWWRKIISNERDNSNHWPGLVSPPRIELEISLSTRLKIFLNKPQAENFFLSLQQIGALKLHIDSRVKQSARAVGWHVMFIFTSTSMVEVFWSWKSPLLFYHTSKWPHLFMITTKDDRRIRAIQVHWQIWFRT